MGGSGGQAKLTAREAVDTRLDQNEAELRVGVVAVALEVLANGDSLLDQVVEVLRDLGGKAVGLKNTENLVSSDGLDLSDSVRVAEDDADLRGGKSLAREPGNKSREVSMLFEVHSDMIHSSLEDLVLDLVGRDLEPAGRRALVGKRRAGDSLVGVVHASHFG